MKRTWGICFLLVSWALAAPVSSAEKLHVLTTVAPLTDIVRHVGGDRISLHGLIPGGVDSHTFEPAPSDIRFIVEADLIIVNGLNLETPTEKLVAANKKPPARILKLGDNTIAKKDRVFDFSFPEAQGDPNPHLWLNVAYAMKYAELVRDELMRHDPANTGAYEKNASAYLAELEKLDKEIAAAMQTIPPQNRKLLTYHDSWPYFARRYGMQVIGAIQPGSFTEPSPRDVASLIDQIKRERLPAVFGSEVFPSKVLDQIGREARVQFISTLRDDDLPGPEGSPQHSYIGMMKENIRTMVTSLGGKADAVEGLIP